MPRVVVIPAVSSTPYDEILADDPVVIVSDVIRATTTGITAIVRQNRCVPVGSVEHAHAEAAQRSNALLVGEQGGEGIPGFELGNSPASIDKIRGRTIILLSSSGTPVLHAARAGRDVLVGCLRNAAATAVAAGRAGRDVVFLAACTRGEFREEDRLLAGWTVKDLVAQGYEADDTLTRRTLDEWGEAAPRDILESASVRFLIDAGHEDDLDFVLQHVDDVPFAVRFSDGELVGDDA
jgi:2-phosphosulfolactate phosphatase